MRLILFVRTMMFLGTAALTVIAWWWFASARRDSVLHLTIAVSPLAFYVLMSELEEWLTRREMNRKDHENRI